MNLLNKTAIFLCSLMVFSCSSSKTESSPEVSIGIIADCQYDDRAPRKARQFKLSAAKLSQAVSAINAESVDWSVHLGDFIDKDYDNYHTLVPIWHTLKRRVTMFWVIMTLVLKII